MRRKNVSLALFAAAVLCMTGCGEPKAAKEARTQGIEQMKAGSYAEAIQSFDTALKSADGIVDSFELDILKYRGEAEYNLADYEAAAHTYGILSEVDDGRPEYLYYKAASEALAGDPAAAQEDYAAASKLDTASHKDNDKAEEAEGAGLALSAIGKAYAESGDYDGAMVFFQQAIDGGKGSAEIYNQMGLCLIRAKRYDEAIASFDQGIALGDENWTKELQYNKGAACEYKGDFSEALTIFKAYVSAYGSTPELEKEIAFLESR